MVIIFQNKLLADELLYEIACTPNDGKWCWWDSEMPREYVTQDENGNEIIQYIDNIISYNYSQDGRVAISYQGSDDDKHWLRTYLEDEAGVSFADQLPKDWQEEILI